MAEVKIKKSWELYREVVTRHHVTINGKLVEIEKSVKYSPLFASEEVETDFIRGEQLLTSEEREQVTKYITEAA